MKTAFVLLMLIIFCYAEPKPKKIWYYRYKPNVGNDGEDRATTTSTVGPIGAWYVICADTFAFRGPCFGHFRRWGYNKKEKKCQPFTYGGCLGNLNNFQSLKECCERCPVRGTCGNRGTCKDTHWNILRKEGESFKRCCNDCSCTCNDKTGRCGIACTKRGCPCNMCKKGECGNGNGYPECDWHGTKGCIEKKGTRFCVVDEDCSDDGHSICVFNECEIRPIGRPFIVKGRPQTTNSQICSSTNLRNAESWKMGEVPLVQPSSVYNQEIGIHWLKQAEAEHASVASFARHTLQLMSIGAPSRLLVASQEASVDEIKHAKICYGFASAFINSDIGPGTLDVNESLESINLKDIIQSLIIEGCIGETLSAIEAHLAAYNAQDIAVKAAISEIASDETKHAQLAWDTIKWIIEKYPNRRNFADDIFRVELERRKTPVINDSSLLPATLCQDSEKVTYFHRYGILVSRDQHKVREAGIRDIIEPIYRAGFKDANMISKQIIELDVGTLTHEAGFQNILEPPTMLNSTMLHDY